MARKKARRENGGLPADMEDEVDVFHKGKEKISLNKDEEDASDEDLSEDEVDVYNLGSEEEEEDEEEDGEESDGESEGRLADRKLHMQSFRSTFVVWHLTLPILKTLLRLSDFQELRHNHGACSQASGTAHASKDPTAARGRQ